MRTKRRRKMDKVSKKVLSRGYEKGGEKNEEYKEKETGVKKDQIRGKREKSTRKTKKNEEIKEKN